MSGDTDNPRSGPCIGLKVIDAAQLVAAPLATTLLADFGADVIKVESPAGDALRGLGPYKDEQSLWYKVNARNKRNIGLDLKEPADRQTFLDLVAVADVLCTNVLPGTFERSLGISYELLDDLNPRLVHLEISGYGQTGPDRMRRAFGRSGEAFGGMTLVTGDPDGTPMSSAIPVADCTSGFLGAFAIMAAINERNTSGRGQRIDLALYESIFRMMEGLAIGFDQLGRVATRQGNHHAHAYPVGLWPTKDDKWASFSVSSEPIAERFFAAIGHPEFADDERFSSNAARVKNREILEPIIADWLKRHTLAEITAIFDEHHLGISPLVSVEDIFASPQYQARADIVTVDDEDLGPVRMQAAIPKFSRTPGAVWSAGRGRDRDREEILRDWLSGQ